MNSPQQKKSKRQPNYPAVSPDIRDWPILSIAREKEAILSEVIKNTANELMAEAKNAKGLLRFVADVYYQERIRIKEEPWKSDPADDEAFWRRVRQRLQELAKPNGNEAAGQEALLLDIVERYAREIAGDFRPGTYRFAKRAVNFAFSRTFNAAHEGWFRGLWHQRLQLQDKMQIKGETEKIRRLCKTGTVILVPTHFSNLDSIVIGWAIETLGLQAFTYGAGINLFSHPALSYFMNRLGAFKVDRRKKNPVYLKVLKAYSEAVLRRGGHMLFFPGGTRSRNGSLEKRLKLGLLGTAIEAQRKLVLENREYPARIYVVPLVISYHVVLEARNLIDEFLRKEGKERFVLLSDDFQSLRKNLSFIWNFFKSSSEMVFSFGEPMDLFGNSIDEEGRSVDKYGTVLDLGHYFQSGAVMNSDMQRNEEYTRLLGNKILERFALENVVFSSHLIAFAAWNTLVRSLGGDIYAVLSMPEEDVEIEREAMIRTIDQLHVRLRELERSGKVKLAAHMHTDMRSLLEHGLQNMGVYHLKRPLLAGKDGALISQDLRLLYYYSNRLNGYQLEQYV